MGRRELADLEAKLFDTEKKGCVAVMLGPKKRGEIDYELHADGGARMKIGLRAAAVPDGTRKVTILINDHVVTGMDVERGSGYLRLESAHGDVIPEVEVDDVATVAVGDRVICSGTFHRD
jgi:hypothetical protein